MNFRQELRTAIRTSHDDLELQYPFNSLTVTKNIDTVVYDTLLCFKAFFLSYLKVRRKDHQYYERNYELFISLPSSDNLGGNLKHDEIDLMALDYIFMGSRMGNKVITQRNPGIVNQKYGEYFSLELPAELWNNLNKSFEVMNNPNLESIIIEKTKYYFKLLKIYGQVVESIRFNPVK